MLNNTHAIERRVFRTFWADGLLDLFGAVGVFGIGMAWTFDLVVVGALVPAVLVPLWQPLRQRLIEPRLGLVEFSEQRERRNNARLLTTALFGVGTLILVVALYFGRTRLGMDAPVSLIAGLPAILLAVLGIVTAFLTASPRFLAYAAILGGFGIGGAAYGLEPGPILVLASVPISVAALWVFLHFLRQNPVAGDAA
jgi:predicted small integral membrane protein